MALPPSSLPGPPLCCGLSGQLSLARVPALAHLASSLPPLQLLDNHGPLAKREAEHIFETAPRLFRVPVHDQ